MKAIEFQTRLSGNKTLDIPAELKTELSAGAPVRVILLIPELSEEKDWGQLTVEQFLNGYAESDGAYDKL